MSTASLGIQGRSERTMKCTLVAKSGILKWQINHRRRVIGTVLSTDQNLTQARRSRMDAQTQQMLIANSWSSILQSAQNHASSMSMLCSPIAAELIGMETQKFIQFGSPIDQVELSARRTQSMELGSRIADVSHGDTMARMHPNASGSIFEAVREWLNAPYPTTAGISTDGSTRRNLLSSNISQLCNSSLNARLRASVTRR